MESFENKYLLNTTLEWEIALVLCVFLNKLCTDCDLWYFHNLNRWHPFGVTVVAYG